MTQPTRDPRLLPWASSTPAGPYEPATAVPTAPSSAWATATLPTPPPPPGWPPPPPTWPPQALPPQPPQPHGRNRMVAVMASLAVLIVVAVGVFLGVRAMSHASQASGSGQVGRVLPTTPAGNSSGNAGQGSGTTNSLTSAQIDAIAAKVNPAVVDVNTVLGYAGGRAAGTGIVLTADGLVLTNNHVVSGATSISVTDVGNGKTYTATVVGYDRTDDVALIRLSGASGLATASLGNSSTVGTGDAVVAIGNAGGTGGTPTAVGGTVTALNQSITAQDESSGTAEQLTGLIEVNADIQAGDSGGPLVDSTGHVIGVDTAASTSFQYQGTGGDGYAIPINSAMAIAEQIAEGKASSTVHIGETAFLGIGTSARSAQVPGAAVVGVVSGSPADKAGLAAGGVIQSVNGTAVDSATTLTTLLDGYHPGDRVTVGWIDASGQSHTSTVTLATGPVG